MYLRAAGYVRVDYPKPSITILTHIGEIRITDDCTAMEGTGIDYLSQHGYMTLRNVGCHLLLVVTGLDGCWAASAGWSVGGGCCGAAVGYHAVTAVGCQRAYLEGLPTWDSANAA